MNWQCIVTIEVFWIGLALVFLAVGIQLAVWAQDFYYKIKARK